MMMMMMMIIVIESHFYHSCGNFLVRLNSLHKYTCTISLYSCTIFQIIHEIIFYHLFVFYSIVIGQFGHCNQDLINLLLTGRATSNVFDGEMSLGDGMGDLCVRGVDRTCDIGYLTHLEALRYCQVVFILYLSCFFIYVVVIIINDYLP